MSLGGPAAELVGEGVALLRTVVCLFGPSAQQGRAAA
jgi:hypothetical protein